MMSARLTKGLKWLLWAALAATVLPLMLAGFYNRPSVDDFSLLKNGRQMVQESGGFWGYLGSIFAAMLNMRNSWSATFTTAFSYITPMVADYRLAWIHPILFLTMIVIACLRLGSVSGRLLKLPKDTARCAGLTLAIVMILLLDGVSEGIYWYNAAFLYTFLFTVAICLMSGILAWCFEPRRSMNGWQWARLALYSLGFFFVGGGNFCTSTVMVVLYGYLSLYILLAKKEKRLLLIPYLFLLAGFLAATLAPGNAVRQAVIEKPSIVVAFLQTFKEAFALTAQGWPFYLLALAFLPVALTIVHQTSFAFKRPWLVLIASYLVLAASIFPAEYSMGTAGPWRMLNLQFFLYCIAFYLNYIYLLGAAKRLLERRGALQGKPLRLRPRYMLPWLAAVMVAFGLSVMPDLKIKNGRPVFDCWLPSVKAVSFLRDGTLKAYAEEYDSIAALAMASPGEDIVIHSQPQCYLFKGLELVDSPEHQDYWINQSFCQFFGCQSILCIEE